MTTRPPKCMNDAKMTIGLRHCHVNCKARGGPVMIVTRECRDTVVHTRSSNLIWLAATSARLSKALRRISLGRSESERDFGMKTLLKLCLVAAGMASATYAMAAEPFTLMFGRRTATGSETRSYFVPKHLGFFKEEGLDVTLQPTEGARQEMQLLAAGKGDAGLGAPPDLLLARGSGAKVRAIFNSVPYHGTSIAVLDNGPLKDPKELKGKK